MKRRNRVITLIVAVTLIFNGQIAMATGSIQDQINNNKDKIDQYEKDKQEINDKKNNLKKDLDSILDKVNAKGAELAASQAKVDEFQGKIDELQRSINKIQGEIEAMDKEIKDKEAEILSIQKEAEEREEMLSGRLRNYYKTDMTSQFIYILVSSESFSSLVSNIFNINKLVKLDNKLLSEINDSKIALEKSQKELKEKIDKLESDKKEILTKQDELKETHEVLLKEKNAYQAQMNELTSLERQKENVIASLSNEEKQLQDKIGDLLSYNKQLQDELDKVFEDLNNGNNNNNGGNNSGDVSQGESFLRPTTGRLTSEYGPRIHPITGANGFHTGIDLANSTGTPIVASKSGKVVEARTMSGYGKTIIIDHGNGYQTLYAHNNSLSVQVGQTVKRGQEIAKMGSTGNSTGPHLHFEIRINGKHTNPMNYIN